MEYQWLIAQLKENENTHYLSADYLPRIIAKIEKKVSLDHMNTENVPQANRF